MQKKSSALGVVAPADEYAYDLDDDGIPSSYRCLCGSLHAESGAFLIAVLGIVESFIAAFFLILFQLADVPLATALLYAFFVFLNGLSFTFIFYAQRYRQERLYVPYFFFEVLKLVALIFAASILLVTDIFSLDSFMNSCVEYGMIDALANVIVVARGYGTAGVPDYAALTAVLHGILLGCVVFLIIVVLVRIYFITVVCRAYLYLRNRRSTSRVALIKAIQLQK